MIAVVCSDGRCVGAVRDDEQDGTGKVGEDGRLREGEERSGRVSINYRRRRKGGNETSVAKHAQKRNTWQVTVSGVLHFN